MAGFQIDCAYCAPPNNMLCKWEPAPGQDPAVFAAAWKKAAPDYRSVECSGCGAVFKLVDDEIPVEQGGSVGRSNISSPRIDSVSVTGGARTGGEALYIFGVAMDVGSLVVKFGGEPVQEVTNRAPDRARIVTPRARYTLNVAEVLATGFVPGEEVVGNLSGSRAVFVTNAPFVVKSPSRAFLPDEEVRGLSSNARVRLASTQPYSGLVDVTVENEHGRRASGSTLTGGFTYE